MSTDDRPALTRETLIAAATRLVGEVGLDGLTVRRLAADLGVRSPALYWHIRTKQELLDGIAEAIILAAHPGPPGPGEPWQDWLTRRARSYRDSLRACRDGARIVTTATSLSPAAVRQFDAELAAMVEAGFAPVLALRTITAVTQYVNGFVLQEQNHPSDRPAAASRLDTTSPDAPTTLLTALRDSGGLLSDAAFDHGLRMLVDGTAAALAGELPGRVPLPQHLDTVPVELVEIGRPPGHRHDQRQRAPGDARTGTAVERSVRGDQPQTARVLPARQHQVGTRVELGDPSERLHRTVAVDAQRSANVLAVHHDLAQHRHDRQRRFAGTGNDPVEPRQRLRPGRTQVLGQSHGHLLVEVEPAPHHPGQPPQRGEVRRRGQVRQHLPNRQLLAPRRRVPVRFRQAREVLGQRGPFRVHQRPQPGSRFGGLHRDRPSLSAVSPVRRTGPADFDTYAAKAGNSSAVCAGRPVLAARDGGLARPRSR
nr:TetR/AcrR family transcriptional regulator C-terminal domain-containing protein [Stackebrandtia nassauensis]